MRRLTLGALFVILAFATLEHAAGATATVTAAEANGFVLNTAGTACGAGHNTQGELGDGTAVERRTPVPAVLSDIVAIEAGYYHTVAAKSDGSVWTWGHNGSGQLGSGNTFSRTTPLPVSGLANVVAVAAGTHHTLAVKGDGTVWAWGFNGYGQLGDGTTIQRAAPVQVISLTNVVAVAAGEYFSLALKNDGTVWAWGDNRYGQLGDGTFTGRISPAQAAASVAEIAAGHYHSVARKSNGEVWTWGYNEYGQLGDGSTTNRANVVRATGLTGVTAIGAGANHTLAVKADGTVWTWGRNSWGQLGDGSIVDRYTPVQVTSLAGVAKVAGGEHFSLALKSDGAVWAWGTNFAGQFGNGTINDSLVPVAQSACSAGPGPGPGLSPFTSRISASYDFTLAAKNDGTVWGWGQNDNGQLGDGTTIDRNSPVQAAALTGVIGVAAGRYHSLAVTGGGSVWSWGLNGSGQLGSGNTTSRSVPFPINGLSGVVAVSAGEQHSLALKNDGTVWASGYNVQGQLGDGTTTSRTSPVQSIGLTGVIAISAGSYFSLALKGDGTVWSWGYNDWGQLGDGTSTQRQSAVQVIGLTNVIAIAAGWGHSLALKSDGTVWGWGYAGYGQLGIGNTTSQHYIARVSDLTDVISIAAGSASSFAVRSNGTVWAWGGNSYGQLGDGSTTGHSTPVQVNGLTGTLAVAAGSFHSLALKADGAIHVWGSNYQGQLGIAAPLSSPVAIGGPAGPWTIAYQLVMGVSPPGAGTVLVNPPSPINYYAPNSTACLTAYPTAGYIFTGWTGTAINEARCLSITGNASVAANFTTTPVRPALRFVPVTPCRVIDTRNANGPLGGPSLGAGGTRSFPIPSACSIPATAKAYSLNLTVVPPGPLGYVTVWPTGQGQPVVSTLNSLDGRIKSNAAIIPAGTSGAVSVFATNVTDMILDINGFFVDSTDGTRFPTALAFYPITPCRVADTRVGSGVLGGPSLVGGASRSFPLLSSACNISPAALAYSLNFTAVPQGPLGYLSVWPTGQNQPVVSTLNALNGGITANAAIVPGGNGGAINLFVTNNTDAIIDINGYFAPPGAGGYSLYTLTPCRVLDTRLPSGTPPFAGGISASTAGVPCGVPPESQALVLNSTVVPPSSLGYLTLWPYGGAQPIVSTLNALDGSITSNMALVPAIQGWINAFATNQTHLLLDISGYFAP